MITLIYSCMQPKYHYAKHYDVHNSVESILFTCTRELHIEQHPLIGLGIMGALLINKLAMVLDSYQPVYEQHLELLAASKASSMRHICLNTRMNDGQQIHDDPIAGSQLLQHVPESTVGAQVRLAPAPIRRCMSSATLLAFEMSEYDDYDPGADYNYDAVSHDSNHCSEHLASCEDIGISFVAPAHHQ